MAKIIEEIIILKVSKIVKDADAETSALSNELVTALSNFVEGFDEANTLIEIVQDDQE